MILPALPAGTRRLFPHYEESDLDPRRAPDLLIARLLEDGDAADLAWLVAAYGEPALADWLERHGARLLSNRSRAFWELALGCTAASDGGAGDPAQRSPLWPL